jgi:hypothetical protein
MGIATRQFFAKDPDLRILAAQAKDGSSTDIWMITVSGQETAKIV